MDGVEGQLDRDAPLLLVTGSEEVLLDRAIRQLADAVERHLGSTERHDLDVADLTPGALAAAVSPSLFGGVPLVVVRGLERLKQDDDALAPAVDEILAYLAAPEPDARVVLVHGGGNAGRAVLTALRKAGAAEVVTPSPRSGKDTTAHRRQFVIEEFQARGGSVTGDGVDAILETIGLDLLDLLGACRQLAADAHGPVDEAVVRRYYAGRAEVSSFELADRLLAGRTAEALGLLRGLLDTGTPTVFVTSAVARGLRSLAVIVGAPRGTPAERIAADVGAPPWKVAKVLMPQARAWSEAGLVAAIHAVADADEAVKGGAADSAYALERMVITVGQSRRLR